MVDTTTSQMPGTSGDIGRAIGATLLAFALSFFAARLGFALGFAPRFILMAILAVFFFVVHLDPIGMLRARPTLRELVAKASVGMVLGVFVMLIYPRSDTGIAGEVTVDGSAGGGLALLKTIAPFLVLLPLLFFTPFLERLARGRSAVHPVTVEEAKISAAFPVFVTLHMGLMLAVPGAMWLLNLSAVWALGLAVLGILLALIETRLAPGDELIDELEEAGWAPRPETASEAWSGLRKGVRALVSSALFVGATIYLSILVTTPFLTHFELLDAAPTTAIGTVALCGVLVLGIFLAVSVLAVLVIAGAAYALNRCQGADPLTACELSRQATARLLGGGTRFVRPDLDDES